MPNGSDRDFLRFLRSIVCFRDIFHKWPQKIYVTDHFIKELSKVMSSSDLNALQRKLDLIPEDSLCEISYRCMDDSGNYYELLNGQCSKDISNGDFRSNTSEQDVLAWFGIEYPDY